MLLGPQSHAIETSQRLHSIVCLLYNKLRYIQLQQTTQQLDLVLAVMQLYALKLALLACVFYKKSILVSGGVVVPLCLRHMI